MAKVLTGHAEVIGDQMVEPGGEIPAGADADTVKRLTAEGRIVEVKSSPKKEAER